MVSTKLSGIAIAEGIAGFVLFWSGLKNDSLTGTLTSLLKGQLPATTPETAPSVGVSSSGSSSSTSAPSSANSSQIASVALEYVGHCYLYGGAAKSGKGCWDCSSFVNWVLGHDLGLAIPGLSAGTYTGATHGPTTLSYLAWAGATTVGHSGSDAQAGDLCVWQTHMGIALGDSQVVSALNPSLGTLVTTISGGSPPGEVLYVRRLK